jgi:hypothetical protein
MRKTTLILTAIALIFSAITSFTACNKKDGIYRPKEKISKIYYEVIRYDSIGKQPTDTFQKKELVEIWRWEKKKLVQIEFGDHQVWAWNFEYKGKRITKITSPDRSINFTYGDKSKLEKIEVRDEKKERTELIITVDERSENNITKLTYAHHTYPESAQEKLLAVNNLQSVMHIMLGESVGDIILSDIANSNIADKGKAHKATVTIINKTVNLTYQGNNVTQAKWTVDNDPNPPLVYTNNYSYDNKINPYYKAICLMYTNDMNIEGELSIASLGNLFPLSENNVTSIESHHDTLVSTVSYKYDYNSEDFPTKQTKIEKGVMNNLDKTKFENHYIYYYEYME